MVEGEVVRSEYGVVEIIFSKPGLATLKSVRALALIGSQIEVEMRLKSGPCGWAIQSLNLMGERISPEALEFLGMWAPIFLEDWVASNPGLVEEALVRAHSRQRAQLDRLIKGHLSKIVALSKETALLDLDYGLAEDAALNGQL